MEKDVFESSVPFRILVGWAEGVSKEDAADIAKGFIQRRFDAVNSSWYVTAPFMGGYFWEVHEGGKGQSYMPAIIEALTNNPGGNHWFPSGDRVFQVMMRDGKPFGVLLQKSESKKVIDSGSMPLRASGKMRQAVFKGTPVLIAGSGILGSGLLFFLASVVMYAFASTPEPAIKDINLAKIPSAQWDKLASIKPTEIVSKIEFEQGEWKVEKRPFVIKDLVNAEPSKESQPVPVVNTAPAPPPPAAAPEVVPSPATSLPDVQSPMDGAVGTPPAAMGLNNQVPTAAPKTEPMMAPPSSMVPSIQPVLTAPNLGMSPEIKSDDVIPPKPKKPTVQKQQPHLDSFEQVKTTQTPSAEQPSQIAPMPTPTAETKHELPKKPTSSANKQIGKPLPLVPGDVK